MSTTTRPSVTTRPDTLLAAPAVRRPVTPPVRPTTQETLAALRRLATHSETSAAHGAPARVRAGAPSDLVERLVAEDDGSLLTEYGLLTVLGATAVGLAIKFVSGGAIWELFGAVLSKAISLVGA